VAIEQDKPMRLTVGASLQHNKYEIQDILNLSDVGVTYKAVHTYLDQPVILQTFNEVAQQRSDIDQLKQRFKQEVQLLVKHHSALRILDCFEENGLPFVVLAFIPNQPPAKLSDWFPVSEAPPTVQASSEQTSSEQILVEHTLFEQASKPEQASNQPFSPPPSLSQFNQPSSQPTPVAVMEKTKQPIANSQSLPSVQNLQTNKPAQPNKLAKRQIPTALVVVSLVGGFLGAGMGLALRIAATPQENGRAALNLLNKEQSFPSEGNWPIRERSIFPTEPTIEQPLYRTNAPSEYTAPVQTLPSESYQPYLPPSYTESPYPELESEEPVTDLPAENIPSKPTVELPPDVDSLYTDEWVPPTDALPADRYTTPEVPSLPNDLELLPPQSNHSPQPPISRKSTSTGSFSIVNQ
jgi:hypothetical protein